MIFKIFREIAASFVASLRRSHYDGMRRIACGWDSQHLLSERREPGGGKKQDCRLSFSPRRRQKLGWSSFICGQGH